MGWKCIFGANLFSIVCSINPYLLKISDLERDGKNEIWEGDYYPLISLDLIFQEPSEQTPITKSGSAAYYGREEYDGGEIKFYYLLTETGKQLFDILYDLFPEEKV